MPTTVKLSQLYSILLEKRGKEEADAIVNYIEDKIETEMNDKSENILLRMDKSHAELKEFVERSMRQQLWAMIALFIPLYLAFFWAAFNVFNK